jgi:hypothetical protein
LPVLIFHDHTFVRSQPVLLLAIELCGCESESRDSFDFC